MTKLRDLGTSGLTTSPLVLGGNVFGWTIKDDTLSHRVLDRYIERGGNMVDTADVYSSWAPGNKGGESETVIGGWLRASGKRDKIQIATKVGMIPSEAPLSRERILAGADGSLKRLGVDTIDLYFAHLDDPNTPHEETLGAFETLIKAGKVRAIGASNFHPARFKQALDVATREGLPHYRVFQPEYHLVGRHKFEGELEDLCIAHNIGVIPFYSLAAGYLTGKYRTDADLGKSARGARIAPFIEAKGPQVLAVMDAVAAETGATLAQIALAWLAVQDGVTAPIASATSIEQLDELLDFEKLTLSQDQLDRLTAAGA